MPRFASGATPRRPAARMVRMMRDGYSPAGTCSAAARTSISRQKPARIA